MYKPAEKARQARSFLNYTMPMSLFSRIVFAFKTRLKTFEMIALLAKTGIISVLSLLV